jgi:putative addiction module component (TIGR02574 family)
MSPAFQTLGLDRLGTAERLQLVHELWDSIAVEIEKSPLTDAQQQEVDRRLAAHQANPNAAIPWRTIESETLSRLWRSSK